ncbi:putative metal-binding protein related to the C-terminal domain of SecA [Salmonella enterica subsp. enterica]|nr:putative metal-binding protein related to the C-terminal domain of SecA [Salmonella enterica subsp. enterica]
MPDTLKPALEAIALHGTEENFALLDKMSPEAFDKSVDAIRIAALELHAWWMAHPHHDAATDADKSRGESWA